MARKINGKDILLFIDPAGATDYDTVVCLTSNGLNRSTATEDASSKCGPDVGPGSQTITIPFAGFVVVEPGTGRMSSPSMNDLWKNSTNIGWKIGPVTPTTGDVTYTGTGWISNLDETFDQNGRATYTGTIQVTGNITQATEA